MSKTLRFILVALCITGCGVSSSQSEEIFRKDGKNAGEVDHMQAGISDLKEHDIEKAIKEFSLMIKRNPGDTKAYLMLGDLYMHMKSYDNAIKYYNAAGRLEPNNGRIFLSLAKCYGLTGNNQEAINSVKKSVMIFRSKNDDKNYKTSLMMLKILMNSEKNPEGN